MVSAFAARQRLVLGQVKVADKSNEIVAIPALLDMLAIEGAIVTIDAIGCQRSIAQKIIDKKADYILALKGNQSSLREDVELFVAEQKAAGFKDTEISRDQTVDGDHGRIETRTTTVIHDVAWLQERHDWPRLKAVVMVESTREIAGKIEQKGFEQHAPIVEHRAAAEIRDAVIAPSLDLNAHRVDAVPQRAGGIEAEIGGRKAKLASAFVAVDHFAGNEPRKAEQGGGFLGLSACQRCADRGVGAAHAGGRDPPRAECRGSLEPAERSARQLRAAALEPARLRGWQDQSPLLRTVRALGTAGPAAGR